MLVFQIHVAELISEVGTEETKRARVQLYILYKEALVIF